jgi:hypothetical protein
MSILQAYLDESGKQSDHPLIAVCCVCAPKAKIDGFDEKWSALLRQYHLPEFHMVRAMQYFRGWGNIPRQSLDERIESLKPFADCIGENLELGLIQAWDVKGFRKIPQEHRNKVGNIRDPYYLAFVRALSELADYRQTDDVLSIVCDYDIETAWDCYRHYQGVRKAHAEIRKKTVSISFADDKYFPALQAADMMAALARHEARQQFYGIKNLWEPIFAYTIRNRGTGGIEWKKMFADEGKAKNCLRPRR